MSNEKTEKPKTETKAAEKPDKEAATETEAKVGTNAEEKKPGKKANKKAGKAKEEIKGLIAPVIVGAACALLCIFIIIPAVKNIKSSVSDDSGNYSVYLNDNDLSLIGQYNIKSVKEKGDAVIYKGKDVTVKAEGGCIFIKSKGEMDSYTNAFVIKDK